MPNGGHICCEYCTYNRNPYGKCDIFGIETNPFLLCRTFRPPKESHANTRKKWPLLEKLKPGVVYGIANSNFEAGNPRPAYIVVPKPTE